MDANSCSPLRRTRLNIRVSKLSNAEDILRAAREKFKYHTSKYPSVGVFTLRYPNGTIVSYLPESDEQFRLDKYKAQVPKDYSKIVLFVAHEGLHLELIINVWMAYSFEGQELY